MHTLAKNQHHNTRLIDYFINKAYSDFGEEITIQKLIDDNIINGTQLAELAISKKSGIPMCPNGDHRDLIDDSDVKTITVQEKYFYRTVNGKEDRNQKVPRYQGVVKDACQKIGVLRVVCYNPFSDRYHFFLIPPSAYINVRNVTIAFDKNTQVCNSIYKKYEFPNFEDICIKLNADHRADAFCCKHNLDLSLIPELSKLIDSHTSELYITNKENNAN